LVQLLVIAASIFLLHDILIPWLFDRFVLADSDDIGAGIMFILAFWFSGVVIGIGSAVAAFKLSASLAVRSQLALSFVLAGSASVLAHAADLRRVDPELAGGPINAGAVFGYLIPGLLALFASDAVTVLLEARQSRTSIKGQ
jgi:hypothetical protein